MNFTSQICTTMEQSEQLLALGLKAETADMCYQVKFYDPFPHILVYCAPMLLTHPPIDNERFIPAWSLHRLIEIYSKDSITPRVKLDEINFEWLVDTIAFRLQECDIYKEYLKEK